MPDVPFLGKGDQVDLVKRGKELAASLEAREWGRAERLAKEISEELGRDEVKRRYDQLATEYMETLEAFLEHVQEEISTLQKMDLPVQVCVARLVVAATQKEIAVQRRIDALKEEMP